MVTVEIQLTDEHAQALKWIARREGISIRELIERAIQRLIEDDATDRAAKWQRASEIIGKIRSGFTDISVRHDDYLAEDFM